MSAVDVRDSRVGALPAGLTRLDCLLLADRRSAPCAWDQGNALSWEHFLGRVGAWHAALELPAGQFIALFHSNALEFAAALYAGWLRELDVVIASDTLEQNVQALRTWVHCLVGEFGEHTQIATPAHDRAACREALPLGLDHQLSLFTSGSSGDPQLVRKSLHQLDSEIANLELQFGAEFADPAHALRICATVSHQHIYGLSFRLLWPLAAGRAFETGAHTYLESVAAASRQHPVVLIASPAHLKRLPTALDNPAAWPELRAVFSSGGPLPTADAFTATRALGTCPIEVYGSTESGGVGFRRQRDLDTPFRPLPQVELVTDVDGILGVHSPHLPDDYWLFLADRAEIAPDGSFRLCGRVDRIVKLEEKRISLTAIETAARGTPWLDGARLVVLDGARITLGLVAIPNAQGRALLLEHGRRRLTEALREALLGVCERVALPRRFRFVDALPSDAQGKTSEAALKRLFEHSEARPLMPYHQWLERTPERAHLRLLISPDMHHFRGHFPEQPILPGVAQLDWVIALARQAFAMPPRFVRMETLKFQAVIEPRQELDLVLDWDAQRGALSFKLTSSTNAHASARVVFDV